VQYEVDPKTHRVDLDRVESLAREARPKMIMCGGTAYPRIWDFEGFARIAAAVGATLVADIAHIAGLVAAGAHPSPFPHATIATTTTHKTLRGPRGGMVLSDGSHAKEIDRAVFPGLQGGPHNHTTAAIAVALKEAATKEFGQYAKQTVANAKALAEALNEHGFRLISGGTDNHLILIDVTPRGINGKPAAKALHMAGIESNYNTIPFDTRKPFDPSGLRIGTPSITSRGMTERQMPQIAKWIDRAVAAAENEPALVKIRNEVRDFCSDFPAPGIRV
jgi:glycine hydroxymethyltransferase